MRSELMAGASVTFPRFTGERVYMAQFAPGQDLPAHLSRWQKTVDAMLRGVVSAGPAFLMVDQAGVMARTTHRRPGLHVDGYWNSAAGDHGGPPSPGHNPSPQPGPGHVFTSVNHDPSHLRYGMREALIIATDVEGCEAFNGEWDGIAGNGGDCSSVDVGELRRARMLPGVSWIGEAGSLLHASVPHDRAVRRTVVRINAQGWLS